MSEATHSGEPARDPFAAERQWFHYAKQWKKTAPTIEHLRCLRLAAIWQGGLHHVFDVRPCTSRGIEIALHRGKSLASFDFDELTRLVFLAHDHCIRAQVLAVGSHLNVMLHARVRDSGFSTRHPDLESRVATWRADGHMTLFPCDQCGSFPACEHSDPAPHGMRQRKFLPAPVPAGEGTGNG